METWPDVYQIIKSCHVTAIAFTIQPFIQSRTVLKVWTKSKLCELHMLRWSLLLVNAHCSSSRCRAPEQMWVEMYENQDMFRNAFLADWCEIPKVFAELGHCHQHCRNLSWFTLLLQAFLAVDKSPDAFPRTETWRRILIGSSDLIQTINYK